jgi:hypothetical protein
MLRVVLYLVEGEQKARKKKTWPKQVNTAVSEVKAV